MKRQLFITGFSVVLLGLLLSLNVFAQFDSAPEKELTKEEAKKFKQLQAEGHFNFELKLNDLMLADKETDGKITKITLERFHEHPIYAYRNEGTIQATMTDPTHLACVQKCLSDSYIMRPYHYPYSASGFGGPYVNGTLKIHTKKKTLTILLTPVGFQYGEKEGPLRQSRFYSWTLAKIVDDMIADATKQQQHLSKGLFSALSGQSVINTNRQIYWETRNHAQLQHQVEELTKEVEELRKLLEEKNQDKKNTTRPERVPVSGKVLINGKPLSRGSIQFIPEKGRPAAGTLGPDGKFQLTTYEKGDGLRPGTYKVTVLANETLGPQKLKWHAPKKYANPKTSGLTTTINGPTDSLILDLRWAKEK